MPPVGAAPPPAHPAEGARLSDLLAEAITTHDREMGVVRRLQQLAFFEREICGLTAILAGAFRRGHAAGVRSLLEQIVDAVSDLQDVVGSRFSPPQEPVPLALPEPEADLADGPSLEGLDEPEPDAAAWAEVLRADCEGVLDEIGDIRDVLAGDEDLLRLVSDEANPQGQEARRQIGKLLVALRALLGDCVERLAQAIEGEEAREEPAPASPPARPAPAPAALPPPVPAQPPVASAAAAAMPARPPRLALPDPAKPVLPAVVRAAAAVAASPAVAPLPGPASAGPPPTPAAAPPAMPGPVAPIAASTPAAPPASTEATGLALASAPSQVFLDDAPAAPNYEQLSEEEAVRALQRFYDGHSGESGLARGDEQELERMARQLVSQVCQGYTFSQTDFASRLKRLKETFTLRKKLHNAMTLAEFKAYFRPPR